MKNVAGVSTKTGWTLTHIHRKEQDSWRGGKGRNNHETPCPLHLHCQGEAGTDRDYLYLQTSLPPGTPASGKGMERLTGLNLKSRRTSIIYSGMGNRGRREALHITPHLWEVNLTILNSWR